MYEEFLVEFKKTWPFGDVDKEVLANAYEAWLEDNK